MRISVERPPVFSLGSTADLSAFLANGKSSEKRLTRKPFHGHVAAGKGSPFYRAHTYHTKVPPQGIEPFICHYTRPGDVVLDPFCGSGMTGIAALTSGRRAILNDLSPAAAFIAHHHCSPIDIDEFVSAAKLVVSAAKKRVGAIYQTACGKCGSDAEIIFTVWGDLFGCPQCEAALSLWRDGLDRELRVLRELVCPNCDTSFPKRRLKKLGHEPVLVHAKCPDCGRQEQLPSQEDLSKIDEISSGNSLKRLWYPRDPIGKDNDELKRVLRSGVTSVDKLFTARNLLALSTLYREIAEIEPVSLRQKLLFAFTASIPRTSRTNKYIPHLHIAPGPILGTMYLPGFYPELNVFRHFENKVRDIARAMRALPSDIDVEQALRVQAGAATNLSNVPDASIDYVFTDPPFGSNISYSDVNYLWECWLGCTTDRGHEAVVSRAQEKSVDDYGNLMCDSFREIHRVLKPGRWMTLVFHNTSADVWDAILVALADARLQPEAIYTFDKKQDSFKQVTADGAVGFDVVLHCRRGNNRRKNSSGHKKATQVEVKKHIAKALKQLSDEKDERRIERRLYSEAIAHFLNRGKRLDMDFQAFRLLLSKLR